MTVSTLPPRTLRSPAALLMVMVSTAGCQTARPDNPGPTKKVRAVEELGQTHPLSGRIWSVSSRRFLPEHELFTRLRGAELILLGEKHDNRRHHELQARMLRGVIAGGRRPAVAWEMITEDEEPALSEHVKRRPADAAGLGSALRWKERGWPAWLHYRPIAEVALGARLPLVAAGVSRATLMRMAHHPGGASPTSLPAGDQPPSLPEGARASLARVVKVSHCGHATDGMVKMMIRAQEHRDTFMARRLLAASARHGGAVLIAGAEHTRKDRGVPFFIRAIKGAAPPRVASVALMEVRRGEDDPAAYCPAEPGLPRAFDYLWFTERVDNEDPCDKFRKQLEHMRRRRPPRSN